MERKTLTLREIIDITRAKSLQNDGKSGTYDESYSVFRVIPSKVGEKSEIFIPQAKTNELVP